MNSYSLTIVQINSFEEPQNIFSQLKFQTPNYRPSPPPIFNHRVPSGPAGQTDYNTRTVTGTSKNIDITFIKENPVLKPEVIGGPRATAGHRKYSGTLEKFYWWPLFYSQHSRSAFLVSIRVSICYVIKQTSRRIQ